MNRNHLLNSPFGLFALDKELDDAVITTYIFDDTSPAVILEGNSSDLEPPHSTIAGCWLDEVDCCHAIAIARRMP